MTLPMTAKMVLTSPQNFVKESIASVPSQNSVAAMANVFQVDGDAITRTIVEMARMNSHAKTSNAKMARSNVPQGIVSLRTLDVTAIVIVAICLTN